MNQKLLIILLSTIFYNGVTCASSKEQSDVKSPEEKLQKLDSSLTDDMKKKVEPTPIVFSTDHLVSATKSAATTPQHVEVSIVPSAITSGNISSNQTVKNENLDSVNQNNSKAAENNTSSHALENKNLTSATDVPAGNIPHTSSSTNAPLTSTDATTTVTSSVKTTIKPKLVSTVAPTPTLTNKVATEQNTPAPAEEKHFDGPSFVGGIVLAVGVIAIGFIAFKYYKSGKIDMSYRTL